MKKQLIKRIAMKHMAKQKLTFMKQYEKDPPFGELASVSLMSADGKRLGIVEGYHNIYPDITRFACYEDIMVLVNKYPEMKTPKGIRIVEVDRSRIEQELKGQGYGTKMYLMYAKLQWDRNGSNPFIFIPQECNDEGGSTSVDAKRVWNSLAKSHPSSGDCIAILKRP